MHHQPEPIPTMPHLCCFDPTSPAPPTPAGEFIPAQWKVGSNGQVRNPADNGGPAETSQGPHHIVATYSADGTIRVYR